MNYFSIFLLIGIILTTTELLIPTNFFIASLGLCFILGSFLSFFTDNLAIILVFISLFTILSFFLMKKFKLFYIIKHDTNRDAYIGKRVVVEKVIDKSKGIVKIYSEFWTYSSNEDIKEKDFCIIKDIKGNTFIIEKESNNDKHNS